LRIGTYHDARLSMVLASQQILALTRYRIMVAL
jgi:hypothetical protein